VHVLAENLTVQPTISHADTLYRNWVVAVRGERVTTGTHFM